jgi:methyl-accepting chemotaxis protein
MTWFKNFKISTKLIVTFLIILILTAILGLFSLRQLSVVNDSNDQTNTYVMQSVKHAAELQSAALRVRLAHLTLAADIVDPGMGDPVRYLKKQDELAKASLVSLQASLTTDEGRQHLGLINTALNELLASNMRAIDALTAGEKEKAFEILRDHASAPTRALTIEVQALNAYLSQYATSLQDQSTEIYQQGRILIVVSLVAIFIIGLILVLSISRAISKPLARAVEVAQNVAKGKLTDNVEVHSQDEVGQLLQALKTMNGNLQQIVQRIRMGTETINTASSEIASGNLDLSSRTEQQASALEQTASAMEELTSTVRQNADNARQANQLSISASEVAHKGGAVVQEVVLTMDSINESSKRIVDIISVIDGIAFQTNILALNAAVEAARAGEQGRGFAVVATEVRNLAQRSASAAKEIKALIDDSVSKTAVGSTLVAKAGTTMEEIVTGIRQVNDIVGEIAAASQEQSTGIEEVNKAIVQMDEVTQQNAALVEEATAATQSLQQQAKELVATVSAFQLHSGAQRNNPVVQAKSHAVPEVKKVSAPVKKLAAAKPPVAKPIGKAAPKASAPMAIAQATPATRPAAINNDDWEEF